MSGKSCATARIHILLALATALAAGLLSVVMRWQVGIVAPGGGTSPIRPEWYGTIFTLHGAGMFFFVLLPALGGGFGRYALGAGGGEPSSQLPARLCWAGLLVHGLGWLCLVLSPWWTGGGPSAGWSHYPPLSQQKWLPGLGMDLFLVSLGLWCFGAVLTAFGILTEWIVGGTGSWNAKAALKSDPYSFGHGLAQACTVLCVPSLIAAVGIQLSDRLLGTGFLDPLTGSPVLHQHLFWFFGHPAVYILILPVMGLFTSRLLPENWRGRWVHVSANLCMLAIAVLGFGAWGHHLFQSGLDPRIAGGFSQATFLISWPSSFLVGLWVVMALCNIPSLRLASLGKLYAMGFVLTFTLGGLGGLALATAPLNAHLHETYWVVGHIHLVLFGGTVLGLSCLFFESVPRIFSRPVSSIVPSTHLLATLPLLILVFGLMHILGYLGMGRRLYELPPEGLAAGIREINRATSWAAFGLVAIQGLLGLAVLEGLGVLRGHAVRWGALVLVSSSMVAVGCAVVALLMGAGPSVIAGGAALLLVAPPMVLAVIRLWRIGKISCLQ